MCLKKRKRSFLYEILTLLLFKKIKLYLKNCLYVSSDFNYNILNSELFFLNTNEVFVVCRNGGGLTKS